MDSLLLMQNIEKSFGPVKALDHARLEVARGEVKYPGSQPEHPGHAPDGCCIHSHQSKILSINIT